MACFVSNLLPSVYQRIGTLCTILYQRVLVPSPHSAHPSRLSLMPLLAKYASRNRPLILSPREP